MNRCTAFNAKHVANWVCATILAFAVNPLSAQTLSIPPNLPTITTAAPLLPLPIPIAATPETESISAEAAEPSKPPVPVKDSKDVEKVVAEYMKKKDAEKKVADEKKKLEADEKKLNDYYGGTQYDLYSLFDNQSRLNLEAKKWYDKLSIRGYTQMRYTRTLGTDDGSATPNLFGDRSVNGNAENFSFRRARVIFFGDVSDYLSIYFQGDFASTPQAQTNSTLFGQLRDLYGDIYLTKDRVHRLRAGLSKVPYGFDNMQSSQNRVALDRSEAINIAVAPNERDLGVFYYYTPEDKQKLFKTLVDSGLKGSGNYGIFAFGAYNGQGGSVTEANLNLHMVSRLTYPWQLPSGQVFETSVQAIMGNYVVTGAAIRPNGVGTAITPRNTGGVDGILEEKIAASFIWYPQPFGIQAEWQVGRGPALNSDQRSVVNSSLDGGYVTAMYRHQTCDYGIFTPYARYQMYNGGYRNIANAPYGNQKEYDLGIEWQIRKEMEIVVEYGRIQEPNFTARAAGKSYQNVNASILRVQLQINY